MVPRPGWIGPSDGNYFAQFQTQGLVPQALFNAIMSASTLFGDGTPGGAAIRSARLLPRTRNWPSRRTARTARWPTCEELWNSTVFVLNYDENDGFFDHVVPPTPDPKEFPEEFVHLPSPAGTPGDGLPVGAGFRVQAFVISPWTVGGQIFSEVSDHTSCLRLIEAVTAADGLSARGPITFPHISRWRRQTFSDFTGALRRVAPQPAPANPQFDPATTAANLAAQQAASRQPLPTPPGATQQRPTQPRK